MPDNSQATLYVEQVEAPRMLDILRARPDLIAEMSYPSFFCTPNWLESVIKGCKPVSPFGLVVRRSEEPIAVLPLEKIRNWLGGTDFRYLGFHVHPDPLGLICAARDQVEATAALTSYLDTTPGWDHLILDFMLEDEAKLWPVLARQQSIAPFLDLPMSFEALLANYDGKKRYKLRNKLRRAEAAGLEFKVAESTAEKLEFLDALFDLHEQRSRSIARTSSFRPRHVKATHECVVSSGHEALLFALRHGERFVAVTYGFQQFQRFFFYQISHDPDYEHLRPGTVVLARTITYLCIQGVAEFNFLQGNEPYKFEWTARQRRLCQVRYSAHRMRPRIMSTIGNLVSRLR